MAVAEAVAGSKGASLFVRGMRTTNTLRKGSAAAPRTVFDDLADGVRLSTNDALDKAMEFLGKGYKEIDSGVFMSADGTRMVRMTTDSDLAGRGTKGVPHINLEIGKTVQKPGKPDKTTFQTDQNKHILLPEEQ